MDEEILPVQDMVKRFRELNPNITRERRKRKAEARNKSYSELLFHPLWKWKRATILELDHFCCANCHSLEGLEVHHIEYKGKRMPWEYGSDNLITLCGRCHTSFHNGTLRSALKEGLPALSDMELDELIIRALKRLARARR